MVFIDAVNEIGTEYKERIYRDFLGIEPPQVLRTMANLSNMRRRVKCRHRG